MIKLLYSLKYEPTEGVYKKVTDELSISIILCGGKFLFLSFGKVQGDWTYLLHDEIYNYRRYSTAQLEMLIDAFEQKTKNELLITKFKEG